MWEKKNINFRATLCIMVCITNKIAKLVLKLFRLQGKVRLVTQEESKRMEAESKQKLWRDIIGLLWCYILQGLCCSRVADMEKVIYIYFFYNSTVCSKKNPLKRHKLKLLHISTKKLAIISLTQIKAVYKTNGRFVVIWESTKTLRKQQY